MSELQLRNFGLVFAIVFALLAAWLHGLPWAVALFGLLSAGMMAAAFLFPSVLASPARLWMKLGELLHRVVSPIVLMVLYAGLFVPFGLLRRWLGGDPLNRRFDAAAKSYWTPCERRSRKLDDFRDQF